MVGRQAHLAEPSLLISKISFSGGLKMFNKNTAEGLNLLASSVWELESLASITSSKVPCIIFGMKVISQKRADPSL